MVIATIQAGTYTQSDGRLRRRGRRGADQERGGTRPGWRSSPPAKPGYHGDGREQKVHASARGDEHYGHRTGGEEPDGDEQQRKVLAARFQNAGADHASAVVAEGHALAQSAMARADHAGRAPKVTRPGRGGMASPSVNRPGLGAWVDGG